MSVMIIKRRSADRESKVTLFPFLAVLLCTMGALIMLLVVIARNVREQAAVPVIIEQKQTATSELTVEQATEILEQIKMGAEEADWFAENFTKTKEEAAEKLNEKKTQLALAEKETQKVKDELERLAKLAEQLERNEKTSTAEVARLQKILEQRQRRQKEEELELAELQKDAAKNAKSYAVVPYKGTSGTFRRPIYIECRDGKVIIQPEGIELTEADFLLADRPDNPLDVVLRTIRQYYIETNQIVRGTEPYPLVIIRPSGVEAYEATRRAVGTWIKEFGYELVEENWKIEYPEPSEELKQRIEKQLTMSRNRMAGYLDAMQTAGFASSQRRQQYRLDHRGNVEPATRDQAMQIPRSNGFNGTNGTKRQNTQNTYGSNPQSSNPHSQPSIIHHQTSDPDISLVEREKQESGNGEKLSGQRQTAQTSPQTVLPYLAASPAPAGRPYTQPYDSQYPYSDSQTQNTQGQDTAQNSVQKNGQNTQGINSNEQAQNSPALNPPLNSKQPPQNSNIQKRADNWALKDVVPFSAAVSRNVKIQCEADKFVLVPQTGLIGVRVVPITNSVQESTDKLVAAIWEFMDSWGSAGEKMYWRPILQIRVLSGGEQRFQELKFLLRNSGLVIEAIEN